MNTLYRISPLILQTIIWPPTRFLFWFFLRLRVRGLEYLTDLPADGQAVPVGVIFALNHSSELDPIILPASLPFLSPLMPMFYTSRERRFYENSGWRRIFYGGFFFKLWGSHPVLSGAHDYARALAAHVKILRAGGSVCIFPEGKKTADGSIGTAHGGVAFLSAETGAPVVPVGIKGLFKMTMLDFLFRTRHAEIIFGEPLWPRDLVSVSSPGVLNYKAGAALMLKKISELG